MAHLQINDNSLSIIDKLKAFGYVSNLGRQIGYKNEYGTMYIVTSKGTYFTVSHMCYIRGPEDDGHMCFTEDEFLNEAIREIRLFEKEERK